VRNYADELRNRVKFIEDIIKASKASGIIFGNSGGKDSALVGILAKMACANTLSVLMPCVSKQNFNQDLEDGLLLAKQYDIETMTVDLTDIKKLFVSNLDKNINVTKQASANIAPRLRMTTLYTIAASRNLLVAGTGNASEKYMGYFTKWGDGAYDFNPIADLTVTEVYEFLQFLNAPSSIIDKAPSAGLFDGQTDEQEMGITYAKIDDYILNNRASEEDKVIIERYHNQSQHKRQPPQNYGGN
jgi:NAD+ synthase